MSGLSFGPLKEVFQIVEERLPAKLGRAMTTIAAITIWAAILLFCLRIIVSVVGPVFGYVAPSIA
jgi:hypothetical protein